MEISNNDEKEIIGLIDSLHRSVESGIYSKTFENIDDEINGFGTNLDEVILNLDQLKEMLYKQRDEVILNKNEIKITYKDPIITVSGHFAYAMLSMNFESNSPAGRYNMIIRSTSIYEKKGFKWYLRHFHWSIPFAGATPDEPFPQLENISTNISDWLNDLNLEDNSKFLNDPIRKEELIKYLQKAKALIENRE